jgi:hypothetical protein
LRLFITAVAVVLVVCVAGGASWAEESSIPGHVVLARAEDDALAIWDSTPVVSAIVSGKLSDADAKARLERDALRVLAEVQPKVASSAKTITVRVIYQKIGDVSPVYGTPTFAGVERYATLKVKAADAASDRGKWKELGDKATPPAWVEFDVVGELPPR